MPNLYGLVAGPETVATQVNVLSTALPREAQPILAPPAARPPDGRARRHRPDELAEP